MSDNLTPVQKVARNLWVKREDLAQPSLGQTVPTGAKVRQYLAMAKTQPGAPMVCGCAATSAMQVYVAWAAQHMGVEGHVFVSGRKTESKSTTYARKMGATIHPVRPGYMSTVRSRMRNFVVAKLNSKCVRWQMSTAIVDAAQQVANVPEGIRYLVVPVGSGLTALGIMQGLWAAGRTDIEIVFVNVSTLVDPAALVEKAKNATWPAPKKPVGFNVMVGDQEMEATTWPCPYPETLRWSCINYPTKYDMGCKAALPDGTRLDPYYAAKAWQAAKQYATQGNPTLLWVPGCRPIEAF